MKVKLHTRRLLAVVPIAVLVTFLALDIAIFGPDSILGPSQVALLAASGVCVFLAMLLYKTPWKAFEKAIGGNVGDVAGAILILLLIGAISGTWTMSGIVPAIVVLALSTLAAAAAALVFQPEVLSTIGSAVTEGSRGKVLFTGMVESIYNTVSIDTGNPNVSALVTSRGMLGMLNTVFLIICAMCFGSCMKAGGMVDDIAGIITPLTRSRTGLVGTTVATGTALNGIVSDQYLSIILSSNIFRESFEKGGYEGRLLSRSVEDSATATSPLFPWSSCGMTQATILSVPTLAYAPFCFFNIISPLMSILIAAIGWKIFKHPVKAEVNHGIYDEKQPF